MLHFQSWELIAFSLFVLRRRTLYSKGEVIIAGDYNIDLLKINNKPNITEYLDSII